MVAFLGFMSAITLVMWLTPDSELGRALRRQLVERPLETLSDIKRHHLIFFVIMAGFALSGGEALAMLGPEVVTAYAVDLAIYLDAVMVTYALSAAAMAVRSSGWFGHAVMRSARRLRPRSKRSTRRAAGPRKPSNDDHPASLPLAA